MQSFQNNYEEVKKTIESTVKNSFSYDKSNRLSESFSFVNDYEFWIELLINNKEVSLYKSALNEYIVGHILLIEGFYKQAFMCLRCFLEQTLFGVKLSINHLDVRNWLNDKKDVTWASIKDNESGLFSDSYLLAFFPGSEEYSEQYQKMAKDVYRECSEFVHSNFHTHNLSEDLLFKKEAFDLWMDKTKVIQCIIVFSLFVRFNDLLTTKEIIKNSESIVMDKIGYISSISSFYKREV